MKLSSRHRGYAITIPIGATAIAYVALVFLPAQARISDLRRELREKQAYVIAARTLPLSIEDTQARIVEAKAYVERSRGEPTTSAGLARLFGQIAQRLKDSGIATTRFEPSEATELSHLNQAPIALAGEGSFEEACNALYQVECLSQPMWIREITIRGDRGAESDTEVSLEVSLEVFGGKTEISD